MESGKRLRNIEGIAMSGDLNAWLQQIGLGGYAQVFTDNGVDLEALRLLTEQDLHDLGVLLRRRAYLVAWQGTCVRCWLGIAFSDHILVPP